MARLVAVDKQTVRKGLRGFEELLDNEPEVRRQHEKQREEFEEFIATEKKRRDDEHRSRTNSGTHG